MLDSRYRVLPPSLHHASPAHHEVLVVTDVAVKTCKSTNPFSNCQLDPTVWHRIEKNLYLDSGWTSSAWLYVKRKREEQLEPDERVVIDIKVSRFDPGKKEDAAENEKWTSRGNGIWLLYSTKTHASDSQKAVTGVDVLFGPDAVDPRPAWTIASNPLRIDGKPGSEPRLTIRHGIPKDLGVPVPRIRKDGKFKILQVSDLHLSTGVGNCRDALDAKGQVKGKCEADTRTLEFVEKMRDEEEPDLVVFSGDQVNGETAPDVQSALFKFADIFAAKEIPYAAIFGNHDDEGKAPWQLSRESQMSLLNTLPFSLSQFGPDDVDGVGNYYIEVLAQSPAQHSALTLYFMDTHSYSPNEKQYKGYDWVKPNQIDWFQKAAQSLKKKNSQYTRIHMNMAFVHIPLPEFIMDENIYAGGDFREPSTAPHYNSGFYEALKEEGILAIGCGHDHVNDVCALRPLDAVPIVPKKKKVETRDTGKKPAKEASVSKAEAAAAKAPAKQSANGVAAKDTTPRKTASKTFGPWMCYAGGSGFGGYAGYGGYHRRMRVWEVDTNAGRITTWTRLECCGAAARERHKEVVIVEGGKVVGPLGP